MSLFVVGILHIKAQQVSFTVICSFTYLQIMDFCYIWPTLVTVAITVTGLCCRDL